MTTEEFRRALHKAPFEPFTIHLAESDSIPVPHPDFVALRGLGAAIVTFETSSDYAIVDLSLVTRLEVLGSQRQSK
jgi:hypothetical protein